jgi:peptidoglycan/LPS O-acetylase OafA/YrhL
MASIDVAETRRSTGVGNDIGSPHLDALRIIAAAGIVVLHYSDYLKNTQAGHLLVDYSWHLNFFVDLFFVISGFVIARQYLSRVGDRGSIARFWQRRFARIYPLHIATLSFYIVIAVLMHFGLARVENHTRYPLSDLPAQFLLLHAIDGQRLTFNFPSWSLSAEMVCYLLFPIFAVIARRRRVWIVCIAATFAAGLSLFVLLTGVPSWPNWINVGGAWRALPAFLLGIALFQFRGRLARLPLDQVLLPLLLLFVIGGALLPDMVAVGLVYCIAVAGVHCDEAKARTLLTRLRVGRWAHLTYSSYMLHMPIATIVITVAGRLLAPDIPALKFALVLLAMAALALASTLSYRYFEDPIRRWSNAAFDRRIGGRRRDALVPISGRAA